MLIVVKGLNHHTAPVDVREAYALPESRLAEASSKLKELSGLDEAAMLCTCNRTEMYVRAPSFDAGISGIHKFMQQHFGETPERLAQQWFYAYQGYESAEHLFRVASGLDSMVLGEGQVLGQVRTAFSIAMECGATGEILNALFAQAVKVGKRARTETDISRNAVSVAHAAIDMAKRVFSDLHNKHVLIVGAGKMCEVACRHLSASGPARITVANRTLEKARDTAAVLGASAASLDELPVLLESADVVISSTAAPHYVIKAEDVRRAQKRRRGRPLYIADIAVPRDVDPAVGRISSVFLYNIDDLKSVVSENLNKRRKEVVRVEAIIMHELGDWQTWLASREAVPLLTIFRAQLDSIRESEVRKSMKKLEHLAPEDREAVQLLTRSIVNKILHSPTVRLKEAVAQQDGGVYMRALRELFDLDEGANSSKDKTGD